jgi:hypothetical protein
MLPTKPAEALWDAFQILTGGNSGSGSGVRYASPGLGNTYNSGFPGAGKGLDAAGVRYPIGVLSKLRVSVVTEGTATSGDVMLTVFVNGSATALTCTVGKAGGECSDLVNTVTLAANSKVAIEIDSTLDQGFWTYTYSLIYD